MLSPYSKKIFATMMRELNIMGPYQIDRVCRKAGLNPYKIEEKDMPYIVKSLSDVMLAYKGREKAKAFVEEVKALYDPDGMVSREERPRRKLEYMIQLGDTNRTTGNVGGAERYYSEAIALAAETGEPLAECRAKRRLGEMHANASSFDKAMEYLEDALRTCEELDDKDQLARTRRELAFVNWRLGRLEEALEHIERALALAKGLEDDGLVGALMTRRAMVLNDTGDASAAVEQLREAIGILESTDDYINVSRAYNNIGVILRHHDRMGEALECFWHGMEAAEKAESPRMRGYPLANMAKCYVMEGEPERAKEMVAEAEEIFWAQGERYMLALLRGLEAWVADGEGRLGDAEKALEDAVAMFRELKIPMDLAWELYEAGLLHKKWGKPEADKMLDEAEELFIGLGNEEGVRRVKAAREEKNADGPRPGSRHSR